ncbi:hypothetical protein [Salidesulfovibrio onnuriiensis]|uniref:hypothetical protein n=1 Tax=Salidesulfovibrio onnuriiensis TaxID=2583823 RepID=UPI0011CAFE97|nr:hypothetical protein [Salidesulfovibrio onnuriiensis]
MKNRLGEWFAGQRPRGAFWFWAFVVFLAVLLVANVFELPHHPHFAAEHWPGFWAVFGFIGAVVLAFVMKKIIGPMLAMEEDCYDRD